MYPQRRSPALFSPAVVCVWVWLVFGGCAASALGSEQSSDSDATAETILQVNFDDFIFGGEESDLRMAPIAGPGFGHVIRNPEEPIDYMLEHRPGVMEDVEKAVNDWCGAYFTERFPRLGAGQAIEIGFDLKLYARNGLAGVNLLDCMLERQRRERTPFFSGSSFFRERAFTLNRFGFRIMQTPPLKNGECPDGSLIIALKPWEHWVPDLCVDLNDLGISRLGHADADTESDWLRVTYALRRPEGAGPFAFSVRIENKASGRSWGTTVDCELSYKNADKGQLIGFAASDKLANGEGFRFDNLDCRLFPQNQLSLNERALAGNALESPIDTQVGFEPPQVPRQEADIDLDIPLFSIPDELTSLRRLEVELADTLLELPKLRKPLLFDAYGYHGDYLPVSKDLPEAPRWTVDVEYSGNAQPSQLILVPALDRRFGSVKSYGFPKRFRILQVFPGGDTRVACEWMDVDCPDYGRMPLLIDLPAPRSGHLRMEVFRGSEEDGKEFFALDEFFAVVNLEVLRAAAVTVENSFDAPPHWGTSYLVDQKTSLGLPLNSNHDDPLAGHESDYVYVFEADPQQPGVIEIDLGQNRPLGWVDLFPATAPDGIFIPGYGFPGHIELEMIPENSDGSRGEAAELETRWEKKTPGHNVVRLEGRSRKGRWIRLIVRDYPIHRGKPTFAMGEVSVYRYDVVYPIHSVKLEGFPEDASETAQLLVDGRANDHPIMLLLDWFHEIERRGHLLEQLSMVSRQREMLDQRWSQFVARASITGMLLVVCVAVSVTLIVLVNRKRNANLLRQQITRDLHDEIGAKVGAIHLFASLVRKTVSDTRALDSNRKIEVIAEEMQQSLRDVLWFTNSDTDTLREMVRKLQEIATSMVPKPMLSVTSPELYDVPETSISVQLKRNVMLIVREALHNATQHGEATRVELRLDLNGSKLSVNIIDDGKGFDVKAVGDKAVDDRPHLGLDNMFRRAKNAKSDLRIESAPQKGTVVSFTLKL